jgi:hypothetical protein
VRPASALMSSIETGSGDFGGSVVIWPIAVGFVGTAWAASKLFD